MLQGVIEGWLTKYGAANIGFGVVVAVILVAIIAGLILLCINLSRISKLKLRMTNLVKELGDIDRQISESQ